ncbi:NADAR family protein [Candidatus Parcubacteria bacterium]|nr:NADAR family protein [Candidatus Parcubacteria bacterium]
MLKTKYQNRDPQLETSGKIIGFYEREFYCFSNFSSFAVTWKGRFWLTSEHAYQASRFMGKNSKIVEKIFKARSADDAYRIAKRYLRNDFGKYRDDDLKNMEDIVRHKLKQNPYVMHKLMQTGKRKIVEDSPKDDFWGWGKKRNGRNELGKIWMKLRDKIIKQPRPRRVIYKFEK